MPIFAPETEIIDKLFLELSHVTRAKTHKELALRNALTALDDLLRQNKEYTKELQESIAMLLQ